MKRLIVLIMCLSALCLTSCSLVYFTTQKESESIGIIGGADGPTSIIVGKPDDSENNRISGKPVRLIRVDGAVYYDTGLNNSSIVNEPVLDGNLISTGDSLNIPKKDNHTNFSLDAAASGYQIKTSTTVEIPDGNNRRIFKKLYGYDIDNYSYCVNLTGRFPNAKADTEFIVLSNDPAITFEEVADFLFSSADKKTMDFAIVFTDIYDDLGLFFYAENATSTGATVKFDHLGGNSKGMLQTGEAYALEVLADGEWQDVPTVIPKDEIYWKMLAYPLFTNDITYFNINWEPIYGKLSPGTYRISKEITDFIEAGNFEKYTYYAEFTLTE